MVGSGAFPTRLLGFKHCVTLGPFFNSSVQCFLKCGTQILAPTPHRIVGRIKGVHTAKSLANSKHTITTGNFHTGKIRQKEKCHKVIMTEVPRGLAHTLATCYTTEQSLTRKERARESTVSSQPPYSPHTGQKDGSSFQRCLKKKGLT